MPGPPRGSIDGAIVTAGGRVLTVGGRGGTLDEAAAIAYRALDAIHFAGSTTGATSGTAPARPSAKRAETPWPTSHRSRRFATT